MITYGSALGAGYENLVWGKLREGPVWIYIVSQLAPRAMLINHGVV